MQMIVEFDINADIVDVPQSVIENREILRRRFLKWIYNKSIKHKYWVTMKDSTGKSIVGVRYRSDAFVEWLNKKVLLKSKEKATILQTAIVEYPDDLPSIQF